ncbi:hypothetical protein [Streptomyces litchfieldiae]|uniref:Lipoprotein n=1 Tax=Streptomyces litchfieldiae TaxID=3075543 RepID=A0ABU2MU12_9ACTN|nr:hypothetical protein [Streptomyces sp. DSM 44938]MDT0345122.1 hypothetical protein [Streptomyces sp. DSM 44938]
MRRSIRLALPVIATATALALTGCNSDDEGSPFDGGSGGQEETTGGETGGETGGDTGGETEGADTGGDTGGDTEPDTGPDAGGDTGGATGGGGAAPTTEEVEGDWYVDTTSSTSNLEITAGEVTFWEDFEPEGDICYGSITGGILTLDSCENYGISEWTAMEATVTVDGTSMDVVWSDGTTETYRNAATGGFNDTEMAELEAMIEAYNNSVS